MRPSLSKIRSTSWPFILKVQEANEILRALSESLIVNSLELNQELPYDRAISNYFITGDSYE